MKKTIIDGHETWWAVCCNSECDSTYWGPYFGDDDWLDRECENDGCKFAHFKARYVPEHVDAMFGNYTQEAVEEAQVDLGIVSQWLREHREKAAEHPNYRPSNRTGTAHERAEQVLMEAVQS